MLRIDNLTIFFVRRFEDLTNSSQNQSEFVKSSKRRTKKKLSNYQNEARDWIFEEKIRMRLLVRKCQIIKTIAYQAT